MRPEGVAPSICLSHPRLEFASETAALAVKLEAQRVLLFNILILHPIDRMIIDPDHSTPGIPQSSGNCCDKFATVKER